MGFSSFTPDGVGGFNFSASDGTFSHFSSNGAGGFSGFESDGMDLSDLFG
jgi:hypothetical protein